MAVGDGRNQVVEDTVLDVDWGNAVADRTVQSFANTAERDAEWIAPQPGATCYTAAEDAFWLYRGYPTQAWHRMPYGYLLGANGPSALKTVHGSYLPLVDVEWEAKVGRVYQITGHAAGSQVIKGGSGYSRLMISTAWGTQHYCSVNDPLVGDTVSFDLSIMARSTNNGQSYATLQAMTTVSGGGVQFGTNSATVWVTDVGG